MSLNLNAEVQENNELKKKYVSKNTRFNNAELALLDELKQLLESTTGREFSDSKAIKAAIAIATAASPKSVVEGLSKV